MEGRHHPGRAGRPHDRWRISCRQRIWGRGSARATWASSSRGRPTTRSAGRRPGIATLSRATSAIKATRAPVSTSPPARTGNRVLGNYIGLQADGAGRLANGEGILITGASGNAIGGAADGERNIISGNAGAGVRLAGGATGNEVLGNYIGLQADGLGRLAQRRRHPDHRGVRQRDRRGADRGATSSRATPGAGVRLTGGATGNQVLGNYIGTDIGGTKPWPMRVAASSSTERPATRSAGRRTGRQQRHLGQRRRRRPPRRRRRTTGNWLWATTSAPSIGGTVAVAGQGTGVLVDGGDPGNLIGGRGASGRQ